MPIDDRTVRLLERTEEVDIETAHGGRRTTIWIVVDAGQVYVRSIRGREGRWFRDLREDPLGVIRVGGERVAVRAVAVRSAETLRRVSAAFRQKYRRSPYLGSVLARHTLAGTLRLEARKVVASSRR